MRELLTIGDAARILGCTPEGVRKMDDRGALVPWARTRGGLRLYDLEDVQKLKMARDARPTKWHPINPDERGPEPYHHVDLVPTS